MVETAMPQAVNRIGSIVDGSVVPPKLRAGGEPGPRRYFRVIERPSVAAQAPGQGMTETPASPVDSDSIREAQGAGDLRAALHFTALPTA